MTESPASPLGRTMLWALIGLLGVALVRSTVGKLVVVTVAPGKIVPSDRVKLIQPSGLGVVRAIHVRDGQPVQAPPVAGPTGPVHPRGAAAS